MKHSLLTLAIIFLSSAAFAQTDSIYFDTYEMHKTIQKDALAKLSAPNVFSTCDSDEDVIVIRFEDATFSGGKHGTIERTWIATDACGNEGRTVQYLLLKD